MDRIFRALPANPNLKQKASDLKAGIEAELRAGQHPVLVESLFVHHLGSGLRSVAVSLGPVTDNNFLQKVLLETMKQYGQSEYNFSNLSRRPAFKELLSKVKLNSELAEALLRYPNTLEAEFFLKCLEVLPEQMRHLSSSKNIMSRLESMVLGREKLADPNQRVSAPGTLVWGNKSTICY